MITDQLRSDDVRAEPGLHARRAAAEDARLARPGAPCGATSASACSAPLPRCYVLAPLGAPPVAGRRVRRGRRRAPLIGTVLLGLAAVPGAQTGRPAMVLLRGLFGARLSYLPTALNLAAVPRLGRSSSSSSSPARRAGVAAVGRPLALRRARGSADHAAGTAPAGHRCALLRRYALVAVLIVAHLPRVQLAAPPAARHRATARGRGSGWPPTSSSPSSSRGCRSLPTTRGTPARSRRRSAGPSSAYSDPDRLLRARTARVQRRSRSADGDSQTPTCSPAFLALAARAGCPSRCWCCASSTSRSPTSTRRRFRCRTCGHWPTGGCWPWLSGSLATLGALVARHRRLPELPLPDRLGVRADVRGVRRRLLPARRARAAGTPPSGAAPAG